MAEYGADYFENEEHQQQSSTRGRYTRQTGDRSGATTRPERTRRPKRRYNEEYTEYRMSDEEYEDEEQQHPAPSASRPQTKRPRRRGPAPPPPSSGRTTSGPRTFAEADASATLSSSSDEEEGDWRGDGGITTPDEDEEQHGESEAEEVPEGHEDDDEYNEEVRRPRGHAHRRHQPTSTSARRGGGGGPPPPPPGPPPATGGPGPDPWAGIGNPFGNTEPVETTEHYAPLLETEDVLHSDFCFMCSYVGLKTRTKMKNEEAFILKKIHRALRLMEEDYFTSHKNEEKTIWLVREYWVRQCEKSPFLAQLGDWTVESITYHLRHYCMSRERFIFNEIRKASEIARIASDQVIRKDSGLIDRNRFSMYLQASKHLATLLNMIPKT